MHAIPMWKYVAGQVTTISCSSRHRSGSGPVVDERDGASGERLRAAQLQVYRVAEQRQPLAEDDGVDDQLVLVDQAEPRHGLREPGAAGHEDVATGQLLHPVDLLGDV